MNDRRNFFTHFTFVAHLIFVRRVEHYNDYVENVYNKLNNLVHTDFSFIDYSILRNTLHDLDEGVASYVSNVGLKQDVMVYPNEAYSSNFNR